MPVTRNYLQTHFNREGLGIEVDFSLPAERVIRALEQIIEWRGRPGVLRCDNGPEYISAALRTWAERIGIRLEYIRMPQRRQRSRMQLRLRAEVPGVGEIRDLYNPLHQKSLGIWAVSM